MATALALVAVFVVVPWWRASSPTYLAEAAVERLETTPGLRYRGSLVDMHGRPVGVDLRLSADMAAGQQTIDGQRLDFLTHDAGTYVRGSQAFWNSEEPGSAGAYDRKWVAGSGAVHLGRLPYLEPELLARTLRQQLLGENRDRLEKRSESTIRGVKAARITVDDRGSAVYVSVRAPYRLVHIEGTLLTGYGTDAGRHYDFDVDELNSAEAAAVDDRRREMTQLAPTVIDPAREETLPAYYVVDEIIDSDGADCSPVSCRFIAVVRKSNGAPLPGTKPQLIGTIRAGKVGGRVIGRCTTNLPPMPNDKPTRVSCVVSDQLWENWARTASESSWYNYGATTFNPGWEGTDAKLVRELDEKDFDGTLTYEVMDEGGVLGMATFARLLKYPGVTLQTARDTVTAAVRARQLPAVHAYVTSGRLADPKSFSAFVTRLAGDLEVTPPGLTRLAQLGEAVERAKKGTGPVALGSWTAPGTKTAATADVIDAGRKEAQQVRLVTTDDADDAVKEVKQAVAALKPPAGYRQLVQIRIDDAANPLQRLGKDDLRNALKEAGLRGGALGKADELVVVNDAGKHTFTAGDFG